MGWRQPEGVIHRASFQRRLCALLDLRKGRRARGFLPRASEVDRAEYGWAQVTGSSGGEQSAAVARIEHHVVYDMTEEVRTLGAPGPACPIAAINPCALARRDQYQSLACRTLFCARLGARFGRSLLSCPSCHF